MPKPIRPAIIAGGKSKPRKTMDAIDRISIGNTSELVKKIHDAQDRKLKEEDRKYRQRLLWENVGKPKEKVEPKARKIKMFTCDDCQGVFPCYKRRSHGRHGCKAKWNFTCQFCAKKFPREAGYKLHMHDKHNYYHGRHYYDERKKNVVKPAV